MKIKEGDRVKYTGKKEPIFGLKNGMEGTVLKVTKRNTGKDSKSWTEIEVNFDEVERDKLTLLKNEVELVEPKKEKKNTVALLKLKVFDRIVIEDDETGETVIGIVGKLKYSHLDDTITVTAHREDDTDVTYSFVADVHEKVEVAR